MPATSFRSPWAISLQGTGLPPSSQFAFFDLDGFPGYRIDLMAGLTVLASDNNTLSIPEGEFRTVQLQFETGPSHANFGQNLGIRLVNLNMAGTIEAPGIEVDFDNVFLTYTPVPEPAGTALALALGSGAAACALRWRRFRIV